MGRSCHTGKDESDVTRWWWQSDQIATTGTLKMREWKNRHGNEGGGKCRSGICGRACVWKISIVVRLHVELKSDRVCFDSVYILYTVIYMHVGLCKAMFVATTVDRWNRLLTVQNLLQKLLRYVEHQWIMKSTVGPQRLSVSDNPSRTNNVLESFHSALRSRVKVAHPNVFAFLAHLERATVDSQALADVRRASRGMAIRRAKKKANVVNDYSA